MPVPKLKDPTRLDDIELRANELRQRTSWEELARQQGVRPVERLEDLAGGWPADQINDGFEEALERWRRTSSWDEE
jgi:hypothetical protein